MKNSGLHAASWVGLNGISVSTSSTMCNNFLLMALSRAWYKVPIITHKLICQKRATLENCVLYVELRRIFYFLSGANLIYLFKIN
ncbi:hypothetical protein BpHYR1_008558 [Brachionus plicatilis]|uniref:Uncharacterized protein n=1 Tax=Brachionus plicatilis TaxID=10195 RepID=A0A3M7R022_BRAPC|nr:hypothetical protein BpHYR1_008558 [Brachionus plicatilis]